MSSATGAATVVVSESTLLITGVKDGTDTITVTASDGTLSAEDKFVVTVGNLPPEVTTQIEDLHIQTAGKTILLDVAGNFTDPNGDTLSFAAMSGAEGTTVSVINVSVLVITGVEVGTATITVTASDGTLSAEDTFEVTVGNRDPEVSEEIEDQHMATAPGFMSLDVSGNFSDPDGDELSFTAVSGDDNTATVSVSGSKLTIIGVKDGTTTITVTATDTADAESTAKDEFVVTVGNRAPKADSIPEQTVVAGMSITLDVSSYFSDPDDDDLTFTAASGATDIAVVAVNGSILTIIGGVAGDTTITVTATDPDEATRKTRLRSRSQQQAARRQNSLGQREAAQIAPARFAGRGRSHKRGGTQRGMNTIAGTLGDNGRWDTGQWMRTDCSTRRWVWSCRGSWSGRCSTTSSARSWCT